MKGLAFIIVVAISLCIVIVVKAMIKTLTDIINSKNEQDK